MQHYYLTVMHRGDILYGNIDDPEAKHGPFGGGLSYEQLLDKLAHYAIALTRGP